MESLGAIMVSKLMKGIGEWFMLLKNALNLRKDISKHRHDMYVLVERKGLSHPEVIKISQQLDEEIFLLQKIICEINSIQKV